MLFPGGNPNGMHPNPDEVSHGSCAGARVMPGVMPLCVNILKMKVAITDYSKEHQSAIRESSNVLAGQSSTSSLLNETPKSSRRIKCVWRHSAVLDSTVVFAFNFTNGTSRFGTLRSISTCQTRPLLAAVGRN
jgi:hypothetical protein